MEPQGTWWCNSHGREAPHVNAKGEHTCPPHAGGIMIPCFTVFAPMIVIYPKARPTVGNVKRCPLTETPANRHLLERAVEGLADPDRVG